MNIRNVDLNLLVYLNVLLEERNVSKAADKLALTQPAMSNALKRLRDLFDDPLLVRTGEGMNPTDKAQGLKSEIEKLLNLAEMITQPDRDFSPETSDMTFRIMANDYMEATLIAPFIQKTLAEGAKVNFDILTPSDVDLVDVEKGTVDLAINRFPRMPKSFHTATVWRDNFCCLVSDKSVFAKEQTLDNYLDAEHLWCGREGWGTEMAISSKASSQRLGWVDEALWQLDQTRRIRVFTRHYMVGHLLAQQSDLIATLPRRLAVALNRESGLTIAKVPFQIVPIEIKMIWSPLRQHSAAHQWLRRSLLDFGKTVLDR